MDAALFSGMERAMVVSHLYLSRSCFPRSKVRLLVYAFMFGFLCSKYGFFHLFFFFDVSPFSVPGLGLKVETDSAPRLSWYSND